MSTAAFACSYENAKVDGRICDWIRPISNQNYCGEVGDYEFDYLVQLPDEDASYSSWLFDALVLKIHVDDEDCGQYKMYYKYSLLGGLTAVGVAAALVRERKKRRRAQEVEEENEKKKENGEGEDEEDEDEDETVGTEVDSYIEMGKIWMNGSSSSSSAAGSSFGLRSMDDASSISSLGDEGRTSQQRPQAVYSPPLEGAFVVPMRRSNDILDVAQHKRAKKKMNRHLNQNSKRAFGYSPQQHMSNTKAKSTAQPSSSQQHQQQIPMEVLRKWYGKKGIAIV